MKFDMKTLHEKSNMEWDLSLTINDKTYRVREPNLEKFSEIARSIDTADPEEQVQQLQEMFDEDARADVATWNRVLQFDVWLVIITYLQCFIEKKRLALREQVRAATASTSGRR